MNNDLRPINTIPNFKRFCMTIGELPTSYLETMTYYEMLVWFTEYMKNTIIPTINNNGLAVEELQDKYIELKSYVDDYFTNLDVQQEINNKLDSMVTDGTLQEIIASYLNSKALFGFDNVESMKNATNLIDGSYAETLGYYSKNDGGSALYKITSTKNETEYQETLNNGLYATLIIKDSVNVKQFGAYGDGIHDDTNTMQKAIDTCKNIIFPYGTYLTTGIRLKDNSCMISENATIKVIPNNSTVYYVVGIIEKTNVSILGTLNVIGDKDEHTGTEGEFGMCLGILGSNNINIENVILSYGWGDGLYIGNSSNIDNQYNIHINNVTCHHNRRNGMSIISGEKIRIDNLFTYNNGGTAPNGGFDIEPYINTNRIDVSLGNVFAYDNLTSTGRQCYISNSYTDNYIVNIDSLNLRGTLSVTTSNPNSIVNIKEIMEIVLNNSDVGIYIDSLGYVNIDRLTMNIINSNLTNKSLIFSEGLSNCFINNLLVLSGENKPYFTNNASNFNLNINHLTYIGELTLSNTRNCFIHINNITHHSKTLTNLDKTITPLLTDIKITEDITNVTYNDIAQYDNWTFYISNLNENNDCTLSFNLRKIVYNNGQFSYISIPKGKVAKIRFDLTSGLFILEYLETI